MLETRLTPAFDLTIGTAPTHVLHDTAGHFTAIGPGATIAVTDILGDLLASGAIASIFRVRMIRLRRGEFG